MEAKKFKTMTLQEFNNLDTVDDMTYELIDGLVMMSPRPATAHQMIMSSIHAAIFNFLSGKRCSVLTETEIELDDSVLVPDLFVYCDPTKLGKQRYHGGPKLVIEILSPSTAFKDMNLKLKLYEKYGVEEYWIVTPNAKTVTLYHFESQTARTYSYDEAVQSIVLEDMSIELQDIFSGL